MPVPRLLVIVLFASMSIASAQVQNQSGFLGSPVVNNDASKSEAQTQREPWQIIPDLKSGPLFPLSTQSDAGSMPGHRLTHEEGFRFFMNRPTSQSPLITLLPDGEYTTDSICYSIRSYVVERDDKDSDSTHPVGSSTCQPANRYRVKKAQADSGSSQR